MLSLRNTRLDIVAKTRQFKFAWFMMIPMMHFYKKHVYVTREKQVSMKPYRGIHLEDKVTF
ncbi:LOW QUALITY PROTEIN: hypothetical protein PanWU01x14_015730 [Parasponia andersonii]|uniref:Uncharacterized protein n=1 Tax=Parasponia andersonii TaxID=3476 RepID=A0A2P5E0K4_PARAD|nr:LOW QUALITY PROTEIN: hypothetical protein PanWU01x14_015730 [Parasponia andersonii]